MDIIVYDFDKTIYDGDSTLDFYFYCLRRRPVIIRYIFIQVYGFILFKSNIIDKTGFKELFFCFLRGIGDCRALVGGFWQTHSRKIKAFYSSRPHDCDVIISASPEFLLKSVCKDIGVKMLIASKVDAKTGAFNMPDCYGEEKVIRLKQALPDCNIKEFYSDSTSDLPLALIAQKSFMVRGNNITEWVCK